MAENDFIGGLEHLNIKNTGMIIQEAVFGWDNQVPFNFTHEIHTDPSAIDIGDLAFRGPYWKCKTPIEVAMAGRAADADVLHLPA